MKKSQVLSHAKKNLGVVEYEIFKFLLEHLVKNGCATTYKPVGIHVGRSWEHSCLGSELEAVTIYTHKKYGFLISSMVHVSGTGQAGAGFPYLAADLGVRINSKIWYNQEISKMTAWARSLT